MQGSCEKSNISYYLEKQRSQNTGFNLLSLLKGNIKFIIIIFFLFVIIESSLYAENADDLYKKGRFAEAEKEYQKMDMDNPRDIRFRYNKGCAAFQNSDYKGAEAAFSSTIRRTNDREILYRSAYNLGNTAFSQNDFASAVEFYKQAIIQNPESIEARYNLELSLKKLKEEKENDKKGDKKNKNDNQKDNSKEKNNNKDHQKDNDKNKNDKQDKQNQGGADENPPEKAKAEMSNIDKQKAEALLDNIKEDRSKIMALQMQNKKKTVSSGKNW